MNRQLILASASPRRKDLLEEVGLSFEVIAAQIEEYMEEDLSTQEAIQQIALRKAEVVFENHRDAIVIGADTMVCFGCEVLGKPKSKEDAYRMLSLLSGKTHRVLTGVAIVSDSQSLSFCEETEVTFYDLTEALMVEYIASGEPFDKAGAYGIQGKGKLLVKEIHGDYYTVVGLPIAKVYREVKKLLK